MIMVMAGFALFTGLTDPQVCWLKCLAIEVVGQVFNVMLKYGIVWLVGRIEDREMDIMTEEERFIVVFHVSAK